MKHHTPAARWAAALTAAFAMSQAEAHFGQDNPNGAGAPGGQTAHPLDEPFAGQGTSTTLPMMRRSMNARSTRGASDNG
jgi:hypothetical protein